MATIMNAKRAYKSSSIQSEKVTNYIIDDNEMEPPLKRDAACEMFCFTALEDNISCTICTDLTRTFPARLFHEHQYTFISYIYSSSSILIGPLKSRSKESLLCTD